MIYNLKKPTIQISVPALKDSIRQYVLNIWQNS